MFSFRVGALVLLISGSAAMAASEEYQVSLGPAARTNATQRIAVGRGAVKVSYDSQQLSIDGTFGGLVSPATDAHLCQGMGIGMVGTCGAALAVPTLNAMNTIAITVVCLNISISMVLNAYPTILALV